MNLHVITCLFNPADSYRLRENYHTFRRHLGDVPVTTVELLFPGQQRSTAPEDPRAFVIAGDRHRHGLWQKERLLNLAIKTLPNDCDAIAWIDADVIFERGDWVDATCHALERFHVCQIWSNAWWLNQVDGIDRRIESIASKMNRQSPDWGHPGFAWAARRDFLEGTGGLFDCDPIGGGDTWMMWGFTGRCRNESMVSSPPLTDAWERWAARALEVTQGRVGLVPGGVYHLYHGEYQNRSYVQRTKAKADYHFDPGRDVRIDDMGLYEWTGANPGLEQFVRDYFPSRQDDGPAVKTKLER